MGEPKPLPHRDVFEKHGETGTRYKFGGQTDEVGRAASAWLAEKQAEREEAASAKRDAREEETLSIARRANSIAITAAIFAAAATIIAAVISVMYAAPR
jgi:hypothetical protein